MSIKELQEVIDFFDDKNLNKALNNTADKDIINLLFGIKEEGRIFRGMSARRQERILYGMGEPPSPLEIHKSVNSIYHIIRRLSENGEIQVK